ncbi:MAG: hypothetical protein CMD92_07105 [Gammaproteobacteria bacterium]|nr:hypothetical protein [Gammaproteobacteria bacterium]
MSTLEFEKDLWAPLGPNQNPPRSKRIAQTSDGVVNVLSAFVEGFFGDRAQQTLQAALKWHRFARNRDGQSPLIFKDELLYLSHRTLGGLLVLKAEIGGAIMSVNTWRAVEASPRALTREEARELFATHTIAVVVDPHRVTAYWHADRPTRPLQLARMWLGVRATNSSVDNVLAVEADVDDTPSAEVLKTRALIKAAREALLPENWALRPAA